MTATLASWIVQRVADEDTANEAAIALKPDALVHYGPTAAHADDNNALITRFPSGRNRRVLDGHVAVGVAHDAPQPAELDRAHHRGLRARRVILLHHRYRPGVRPTIFSR